MVGPGKNVPGRTTAGRARNCLSREISYACKLANSEDLEVGHVLTLWTVSSTAPTLYSPKLRVRIPSTSFASCETESLLTIIAKFESGTALKNNRTPLSEF